MRTMQADSGGPSGQWLHSFEEDSGDLQVYRPAGADFAPARRPREGLLFDAQGGLHLQLPGPDDRLLSASEAATPLGMGQHRLPPSMAQAGPVLEIVEQTADRLVVRALPG